MMSRRLVVGLVLSLALTGGTQLVVVGSACADEPAGRERCTIRLRVVEGNGKRVADEPSMQGPLGDVRTQLTKLPFENYHVVDESEHEVPMAQPGVFQVRDAQQHDQLITVTPHRLEHERLKLSVDWKTATGDEVISTKVRVNNGHAMVFGADGGEGGSTILCIQANCR